MNSQQNSSNDEVIVLPWWRNPVNIGVLIIAVVALVFGIGYNVGHRAGDVKHNGADTGFLQDMRIHHEQAVLMATLYLNANPTGNSLERTIASEIQFDQTLESGRMVQLLRIFGESETNSTDQAMAWMGEPVPLENMAGLATDSQLSALAKARGVEADRLFAQLMIAHHEGGIHMLDHIVMHGSNHEVRLMANAMSSAQAGEITELKKILASLK